jgi:DNA integrity scanning protein DisA with diadenylate cyclase activity
MRTTASLDGAMVINATKAINAAEIINVAER